MKRKTPLTERETAAMKAVPETADAVEEQIVKRPDGYYRTAPDGKQEIGPFSSYEDALADQPSPVGVTQRIRKAVSVRFTTREPLSDTSALPLY